MKECQPDDVEGRNRQDKKRKADAEHPDDPERTEGRWMRAEWSKRKAEDEDAESRLKNTKKYLKQLEKTEVDAEIAEVEVHKEVLHMEGAGAPQAEDGEQELDPGTRATGEEIRSLVHGQDIADVSFCSCAGSDVEGGQSPHRDEVGWMERESDDDGNEFVRCRLVARDVKP